MDSELYKAIKCSRKDNDTGILKKDTSKKVYRLGEVIANGVKYFGQDKFIRGHTTAMCVCPKCTELWRVDLTSVRAGTSKSCGCTRKAKIVGH